MFSRCRRGCRCWCAVDSRGGGRCGNTPPPASGAQSKERPHGINRQECLGADQTTSAAVPPRGDVQRCEMALMTDKAAQLAA